MDVTSVAVGMRVCSDKHRPQVIALIADDGCDRNDVVGICGMAHPQEKSHCEDGKKADHVLYPGCLDCRCLAQFDPARRKESQILFHALPSLS